MQSICSASDLLDVMKDIGAIKKGHFHLSSGLHSDTYIQCAKALMDPYVVEEISNYFYSLLYKFDVDLVVSPAMGGIIIGHEIARGRFLPFLFTERVDGKVMFRRGFDEIFDPDNWEFGTPRVLVAEDVITTGKSTQEVIDLVHTYDAKVVAVSTIIDRSIEPINFNVEKQFFGARIEAQVFHPDKCLMCATGEPLDKPGSRR